MINLLPYDNKREIRAGRVNVILLNYVILAAAGFGLLLLTDGFAYFSLTLGRSEAQTRVDQNDRDTLQYTKIQSQAAAFRQDLSVAKTILDKDVSYSSLLLEISKNIPDGVVLDSLNLDQTTLDKPTVINAHARNKDTALKFKSALENQPDIFDDVKFTNINFEQQPSDRAHPVAITMSIIIKKKALQ